MRQDSRDSIPVNVTGRKKCMQTWPFSWGELARCAIAETVEPIVIIYHKSRDCERPPICRPAQKFLDKALIEGDIEFTFDFSECFARRIATLRQMWRDVVCVVVGDQCTTYSSYSSDICD
jgi:hypothetical protein